MCRASRPLARCGCPARTRPGEVERADAATGRAGRSMTVVRTVAPSAWCRSDHLDASAEHVRVRGHQRRVAARDLDDAHPLQGGVEAERRLGHRPAAELVERRDVRRHRDLERLPGPWSAADDPGRAGGQAQGDHPGDRTEHLGQGGQVVRTHVQQRSGAGLVEEVRVGVPVVGAALLHDDRGGQRSPDVATLDHPPGGLDARTEHGVGGATQAQAEPVGFLDPGLHESNLVVARGFSFQTCLPAASARWARRHGPPGW